MIDGRSVLGVVPARGGSQGIPGKNITELAGRPLLAWTAEAALSSSLIDRTILSSDDEAILAVGRACGLDVPFVRPAELARNDTPGIDPVLHALAALEPERYDQVVLLQPTSPLRTADDIDEALRTCHALGAPACVSVTLVEHSPWTMFTLDGGRLTPLLASDARPTRRQDAPPVYRLNGGIYIADTAWLERTRSFVTEETRAFEMPAERSIDIDSPLDLALAEAVIQRRQAT
jgi:N-acylneuraminate cytidylyltransferase